MKATHVGTILAIATGILSAAFGNNIATAQVFGTACSSISGMGVGGQLSVSGGLSAFACGVGATSTGDNSMAVGTGASATGFGTALGTAAVANDHATAVGNGAQALGGNSVAIGLGSIASAPNTVSVGAVGAERRIVNVASGVNATDAVNLGQLNDYQRENRRGIAGAVAMGSFLTPSAAGKTTVTLNGAYYHGEGGMGFSLAHRLKVDVPVVLHGTYGNGGGNEHIARAGVGFEF